MYTYLTISEKRGWEGMDEGTLLPRCSGMLTHDCWMPYWHYEGFTHNVCRAHLLRELQNVMDNHPEPTPTAEKKHGRPKRGKVLALIDRLKKYKKSICLIITE